MAGEGWGVGRQAADLCPSTSAALEPPVPVSALARALPQPVRRGLGGAGGPAWPPEGELQHGAGAVSVQGLRLQAQGELSPPPRACFSRQPPSWPSVAPAVLLGSLWSFPVPAATAGLCHSRSELGPWPWPPLSPGPAPTKNCLPFLTPPPLALGFAHSALSWRWPDTWRRA